MRVSGNHYKQLKNKKNSWGLKKEGNTDAPVVALANVEQGKNSKNVGDAIKMGEKG